MARLIYPPETTAPSSMEHAALLRRDLTAASVSGWSYRGCFSDSDASNRILTAVTDQGILRNHPGYCCGLCTHINPSYSFCSVEVGGECYCDSTTHSRLTSLPAFKCDSQCPGAGGAACGGYWALGLYVLTDAVAPATTSALSVTAANIPGYSYLGCYTDHANRILNGTALIPQTIDPAFCCEFCAQQGIGYPMCGVENASQCYCDSTLSKGALRASATECSQACSTPNSLQCGAAARINVYSATGDVASSIAASPTSQGASQGTSQGTSSEPSPSGSPNAHGGGSSGLSGGAIGGIVIGAVVLLLLICLWFARRRVMALLSGNGKNNNNTSYVHGPTVPENKDVPYQDHDNHGHGYQCELDGTSQQPVGLTGSYPTRSAP